MKKVLLFVVSFLLLFSVVKALDIEPEVYSISTNPKVLAALSTDKKEAAPGETVVVSVKNISKGYVFGSLVINSDSGTKLDVQVKDLGNGRYEFTMPSSNVYIDAVLTTVNPRTYDNTYIIVILLFASAIFLGVLYILRRNVNQFE